MSRHDAIVVGGGLAGIACAVTLARAGLRVLMLERRRELGGRAGSFHDSATDQWIDNCQHVTLGCCERYIALLQNLGVHRRMTWTSTQHWLEPGGRVSTLKPGPMPRMLSHAWSLLTAPMLSIADKLAIARAGVTISSCDRNDFRDVSFLDFLRAEQQTQRAISRFWRSVVVSACNGELDTVCAASALHVFQDGVLAGATASRIGVPHVPLRSLYESVPSMISAAGGEVRLGVAVLSIGATSVQTERERLDAPAVVCALPFEKAIDLVAVQDDRFARMRTLTHSPILGVHLRFDRPVLTTPHAVLLDRSTQWLFRKDGDGAHVHAVISAAGECMQMDETTIVRMITDDIRSCIPGSREARVVWSRAVRERRATFLPTVSAEAARRGITTTGKCGVYLAGDYTNTGWPATMEGAVRSGEAAGKAITARHFLSKSERDAIVV